MQHTTETPRAAGWWHHNSMRANNDQHLAWQAALGSHHIHKSRPLIYTDRQAVSAAILEARWKWTKSPIPACP